jgi:hypothetical protein
MRNALIGIAVGLLGMAVTGAGSAESGRQGTGSMGVAMPKVAPGAPVTVTATAKAQTRLAGYIRLMICVNGRACGQGAAFWGGGPRKIEALARCAFKRGSGEPKIEVKSQSCTARLPDAAATMTGAAKPGADAKLLARSFHGGKSCAEVLAAAKKYCCEFKARYKSPHGC